ncbi:MAG: DUF4340 domain-containing protein [Eubacterium sp.]
MKKQQKQFFILLFIAVIVVVAYICVRISTDKAEEKEIASKEEAAQESLLLSVDSDVLESFSYMVDGTELSFTQKDGIWTYDGDESIDIDEDALNKMLLNVESISKENEIDNPEDLSQYGLDEPSNTIKFVVDKETYTLYTGNENSMTEEYYIMLDGSTKVYTIATDLNQAFSKTVEELTAEEETETTAE